MSAAIRPNDNGAAGWHGTHRDKGRAVLCRHGIACLTSGCLCGDEVRQEQETDR